MAEQYHNPFASMDLIAPIEHRDFYDWYCQTGGNTSVDQSPFFRMVDFWFAGLSLAAHRQLKPVNLSGQETFKFIDGSIFDRDSWRVQAVMLIAIAVEDNVEIVGEPRRHDDHCKWFSGSRNPAHCRNATRWQSGSDMESV